MEKLERPEENLRSTLLERRKKKLFQLTPRTHPSLTYTQTPHTHTSQATASGRKTLGPMKSSKGKGQNTPYRKPERTPVQPNNRPSFLSLAPSRDMDLGDIRATLYSLVSLMENEYICLKFTETFDTPKWWKKWQWILYPELI